MGRSTKVRQECIIKVKEALRRNGFPRQKDLALEVGLTKNTVSSFLNGKAIDHLNFTEICQKLSIDWKEIAALGDETTEPNKPNSDTTQQTLSVNTTVTFNNENVETNLGDKPNLSTEDYTTKTAASTPATDKKVALHEAIPAVPVWKGRDELLNDLKTKLLQPENPPKVLALIGQGGIGKTSLAVKLLEALGVNLSSRIVTTDCPYQCAMYFKADVGTSFDEVADFLLIDGLDFKTAEPLKTADEKIAKIIAGLTETRCLLVLDNLESILQPANDACSAAVSPTAEVSSPQAHRAISPDWGKLLNALVYQQHQSKTILTSWEVPADLASRRYEGLEPDSVLVEIKTLAGVSADAGVEILQQRQLQDKQSDLQWVSERVEGHVFLLTQLAAIGKGKPGYLREHPELVTKKAEPILREQLQRQSEAARDLLRRMCVLRVGIDVRGLTFLRLYTDDWEKDNRLMMAANQNKAIEFTEAEISETEVLVERLVNSSLVQIQFDQDKCEILYDLQQVIAEFMRQDYEQLPSLFKRVDLFYSFTITFEDIKKNMSALERFKEATIFALNVGDEREHLRLVKLMLNYHFRLGNGNFIENALMQHPNVVEGNNQAKILLLFGSSHYEIGNWEEAKRCFETALATAQAEGKREEVARAIGWLGCIERDCGNWEEAERLYRQCTWEEAERLYRQCLEVQTDLGDRSGMATSILCLGEIEMLRGNLNAAEPLIKDAMTQLQKLGKTHKVAYSYYDLARLERKRNNTELAQQHYNPHSADVAWIFLSVVKAWSQYAFGLNLCGFSVTGVCQIYLD